MTRGKKIRTMREAKGWRQEDLAREAGLARITVVRLEADEQGWEPSVVTLTKIARALDVSVGEFVERAVASSTEINGAVQQLLHSGEHKMTLDEIDWLRSLPQAFWSGWKVSPEAILELLKARAKVRK